MTQGELLNKLEFKLGEILSVTREKTGSLDIGKLQERKQPNEWTALECLAHHNAYCDAYFAAIERAVHKAKARGWLPDGKVRYTLRGRRAVRRADPENGKRYKSRKRYNFKDRELLPDTLKSFIINNERLLRIVRSAHAVDINRSRVRKAHSWRGQYTLGNLLEFLTLHAERHLRQALKQIE